LCSTLISAGRYDEAFGHCEKLPADFVFKSGCLGRTRFWQGRVDEAIHIFASSGNQAFLAYAYARAGRREEAEKLAVAASLDPIQQARIFAGLGDKDRAFEALDRAVPLGPVVMGRDVINRPEFALLRGDPRVKAFRKKVGLPE
jgi:hypothetical protein